MTPQSLRARVDKLHAANAAKREARERRTRNMGTIDRSTRISQMVAAAQRAIATGNTPQPRDARVLELLTSAAARRDLDIA